MNMEAEGPCEYAKLMWILRFIDSFSIKINRLHCAIVFFPKDIDKIIASDSFVQIFALFVIFYVILSSCIIVMTYISLIITRFAH